MVSRGDIPLSDSSMIFYLQIADTINSACWKIFQDVLSYSDFFQN